MPETAASFLTPWSAFFATMGTSAGALTGLMFVVITIVAGVPRQTTSEGLSTYSTPTVIHFCAALYVSAIALAPWHSLVHVAVAIGLCGIYGVGYVARVMIRTSRITAYVADLEDWIWYCILPLISYAAILASAIALVRAPIEGLYVLAGSTLAQIFIGIRNSWDVVTFLAVRTRPPSS
jgi:hypothetical protein